MVNEKDFLEIKTIDNTRVKIQKSNVGAIEEIPASARTEGYIKVYVEGFSFSVRMTLDEFMKLIQ
jgi:hypothetical protein